ncbi:phosphatase 2C-like domain-containing protein [Scenedesmus sp. NREL 46B-D3]|nr:phosphatase 2C-like domain-containing protein [Scenedesmus sp. NREL 46B-D3]
MRSFASKKLWNLHIARLAMQTGSCGRSQLATGTQSIGMKTCASLHGPPRAITAVSNLRSSARVAGPLQAAGGGATGWPMLPLHVQRKVNVWARSFHSEDALASPPAAPALPYSNGHCGVNSLRVNPSALGSSTAVETEPVAKPAAGSPGVDTAGDSGRCSTAAAELNGRSTTDAAAPPVGTPSRNGTSGAAAVPAAAAGPSSSSSTSSTTTAPAEAASNESSSTDGTSSSTAAPVDESSSSSSSSSEAPGASGNGAGPAVRLTLQSGAAMLPHPDKAHRGGEDSFFIAEHQAAVGVADGVGGWAEIGVDAGAYARLLMVHAKEAADVATDDVAAGTLSPQAILESAFYRTNVQGSSTACVLVVNGTTLSASNLGDSGFVLVRDGVATFQCPQQQHNFNFPFQLGSADSMSDQPQAAMRFDLQLQPGDIIVTGSDGLWDNIFAEEAATIASKCRDKGETATTAAQVLCRYARMRASDAKYHSPFSYSAIQAGYVYLGGKMDDITVVVSYVTLPAAKL